jgi:hypothetical protein
MRFWSGDLIGGFGQDDPTGGFGRVIRTAASVRVI